MNTSDRLVAARQKRLNDRARKARASALYLKRLHEESGLLAIFAPQFTSANMVEDTWFRSDQKNKEQTVILREYEYPSDNPFDEDSITFQRKRSSEPEAAYQALGPSVAVSNVIFPLSVDMPAEYMGDEGTFDFRFQVISNFGGTAYSPATRAILDWTPPSGSNVPGKVQYPFGPGHLIDTAYLDDLPGGELIVTVPAYEYREATDKIIWAWLSRLPDEATIPADQQHTAVLPDDHKVSIPVSVIQAAGEGDGRAHFVYILFDKALNWSHLSDFEGVAISLGDAPGPVNAPLVPLADDGLSYADAGEGVEVLIETLKNFRHDDKIVVKWGNTLLEHREIGLGIDFPLRIPVPVQALRAEYPASSSGVVSTQVSYEVQRGQNAWPSPAIDIDVDLSTIGPTNPGWPSPVNPDLPPLKVTSASGAENIIEGEDNYGEDAVATFALYAPSQAGEVIQLYWNNVAAGDPYVVQGDETPGQQISITVPWAIIEAAGDNLALLVSYGIRADGSDNELRCASTRVRVIIIPIHLAAPTFPQIGNRPVNCDALYLDNGRIHIQVPADSEYIYDGVKVTVHWRGFKRADLSDGLPPHPGDAVPAADMDVLVVWSPTGNVAYIYPPDKRIGILHDSDVPYGFCQTFYTIEVNGQTITSSVDERRAGLGRPDGLCPWPAPIPTP